MNKKVSLSNIFQKIFTGLAMGLKRYPVTALYAAIASVCGLILVNLDEVTTDTERLLASIIMSVVLGALVALGLKTVFENNYTRLRIKIFAWIVFGCSTILYIAYLYGTMEHIKLFEVLRFSTYSLAAFVIFMTAVFRRRTFYQEVYSTLVGWRLAITTVYTLIIWGGVSLILFAIERLLNVNIAEEAYMNTIIILLGFFSPAFFLSGIPGTDEILKPAGVYKFFRILVIYVIAPLLTAYTVVFYIYAIRMIIIWDWPDGIVGNMVLWYALIGTVAMYFLHGMDGESKWAALFGKWFPRIVLLPIILLFIALGIRVSAYGMTVNRYLLGATGIWMLGCAVYMSIRNYRLRNTRLMTMSLVLIALLSFTGPWNSINASRISQTNRLRNILVENNMLGEDSNITAKADLDTETKGEISDKLRYLESNFKYKRVDFLPAGFTTADMEEVFGFDYTYYYPEMPWEKEGEHVQINSEILGSVVPIGGYEYIWDSDSWDETETVTSAGSVGFKFERANEGSVLYVNLDGEEVFKRNIEVYVDEILILWEEFGSSITYDQLTFDETAGDLDLRLIFTGVEVYPGEEKSNLGWIRFYVLVNTR